MDARKTMADLWLNEKQLKDSDGIVYSIKSISDYEGFKLFIEAEDGGTDAIDFEEVGGEYAVIN